MSADKGQRRRALRLGPSPTPHPPTPLFSPIPPTQLPRWSSHGGALRSPCGPHPDPTPTARGVGGE